MCVINYPMEILTPVRQRFVDIVHGLCQRCKALGHLFQPGGRCTVLLRLGLPFEMEKQYAYARFSLRSGYEAMEYLLDHSPDITTVFAMSDLMALGAIRALQDHGLRVPQDISVAGYDGIALGQYSIPRLTTIRQDMEQLAQRSAKILLHCIEEPGRAVHEVVPFDLIEGESVGKV